MAMKVLAIVMARMGSTRLPDKVLKKINDKAIIEILLERLSHSNKIDKIILATSNNPKDDKLADYVANLKFDVFRGSEEDVLSRYYHAAKNYKPDAVMRITGDCPLIDPDVVDDVINVYFNSNVDYVSNADPPSFPDGLDAEIFSFKALETAHKIAVKKFDREHVTPIMRTNNAFTTKNLANASDCSAERWTLDENSDFIVIKNILNHFKPNLHFSWKEALSLKNTHPEYFEANKTIARNEGSALGSGQKLYKRAKNIIPGGTMLFSKRPELFLPEKWPSYFSKAKGCKVWDLDDIEYTDMSIMGIGTNTLGYGNDEVDEAVRGVIDKGNMSTFNCPEEVYLAEKLIELHPWADMVRFARSGGEANSISIRIARASSKKDKVAICGYHGWHDWYLSANLGDDSGLDGHLLPGLEARGVPRSLLGTTIPFHYNDFDSIEKIVQNNDIGVIKMEVSRSVDPKEGFLESVRKLADDNDIVLIFDECTSGFRETFGGLHKKYKVEPDLMMLGKTLGNGYAITAVIGKKEFMKFAEETFISSTFWTERIGPTAALKTLEVMGKSESWKTITRTGKEINSRLNKLANKYGLPIEISGLPALTNFIIRSKNWQKYKTYITQEMLKKKFLASNSIYVCVSHNADVINEYFDYLDTIFSSIASCEFENLNIDDLLEGPLSHSGFKRLN